MIGNWQRFDNPQVRGAPDATWVSPTEDYEVTHAAKQHIANMGWAQTHQNLQVVKRWILEFPAWMKEQGRIRRTTLMGYLRAKS